MLRKIAKIFSGEHDKVITCGCYMEKAVKMGRISATGSFHLFIGATASNMIMAVGTVVRACARVHIKN